MVEVLYAFQSPDPEPSITEDMKAHGGRLDCRENVGGTTLTYEFFDVEGAEKAAKQARAKGYFVQGPNGY